ncbi:hypothetical protein DFR29_101321 [Tahibacter aquaticus]|uniref:Type IV pilin accessory protein n=1 Tax=Tahibacter aquaticus TaxID=520092 RepID=A0A4R6Z9U6_9GAMM|nr:TfpX/TfpZ family type IV pilin accessory protein [Tahibacter aquaticus]TDR48698.1 hypothetical protein DFR29_101321 [Tahibacter aquaticus]
MSRWKAAAIHLYISFFVGLAAAALIFGLWYPPPYSTIGGASKLVLVLLGVDLALGPLLTLIVYRQGKWGMKFDLIVIGVLQLAALSYGLWVITFARPVFVLGAIDRFVLVPADALEPADLAQGSRPEFRRLSWTGPILANALSPTDREQRNALLFSGAAGKDIEKFPKFYADYASSNGPLLARAQSLDELAKLPGAAERIDPWLKSQARARAQIAWLPLLGRGGDAVLLLDKSSGEILDSLPIDPW